MNHEERVLYMVKTKFKIRNKKQRLHGCRRAERSYSMFKVRKGELIQGKEQWVHFAGAAMKRYPTYKIRETQVRW